MGWEGKKWLWEGGWKGERLSRWCQCGRCKVRRGGRVGGGGGWSRWDPLVTSHGGGGGWGMGVGENQKGSLVHRGKEVGVVEVCALLDKEKPRPPQVELHHLQEHLAVRVVETHNVLEKCEGCEVLVLVAVVEEVLRQHALAHTLGHPGQSVGRVPTHLFEALAGEFWLQTGSCAERDNQVVFAAHVHRVVARVLVRHVRRGGVHSLTDVQHVVGDDNLRVAHRQDPRAVEVLLVLGDDGSKRRAAAASATLATLLFLVLEHVRQLPVHSAREHHRQLEARLLHKRRRQKRQLGRLERRRVVRRLRSVEDLEALADVQLSVEHRRREVHVLLEVVVVLRQALREDEAVPCDGEGKAVRVAGEGHHSLRVVEVQEAVHAGTAGGLLRGTVVRSDEVGDALVHAVVLDVELGGGYGDVVDGTGAVQTARVDALEGRDAVLDLLQQRVLVGPFVDRVVRQHQVFQLEGGQLHDVVDARQIVALEGEKVQLHPVCVLVERTQRPDFVLRQVQRLARRPLLQAVDDNPAPQLVVHVRRVFLDVFHGTQVGAVETAHLLVVAGVLFNGKVEDVRHHVHLLCGHGSALRTHRQWVVPAAASTTETVAAMSLTSSATGHRCLLET
eukprot:Rhum_TRINITY_DN14749_c3_g1::Rhum_TRINITY_DN14749_c3_g1_i1::g.116583::m.116583